MKLDSSKKEKDSTSFVKGNQRFLGLQMTFFDALKIDSNFTGSPENVGFNMKYEDRK